MFNGHLVQQPIYIHVYLLGLVLEVDPAPIPPLQVVADEPVDVGQEVVADHGGAGEVDGEGMQLLVELALLHDEEGAAAEEGGDGARVAALEQPPLALEH